MKRAMKKKMLIAIVAILGISAFGMTLLSYISSAEDAERTTYLASNGNSGGSKNTIDVIIENSNRAASADNDPVYHIVEISSSGDSDGSGLRKMVQESNAVFRKLVFDGHKTVEDIDETGVDRFVFNTTAGMIEYQCFSLNSNDADVVAAIKKADFIYLSNDFNKMFDKDNDISEDVKVALSSVVTGNYVPFMIDGHLKTYEGEAKKGNNFTSFVTNVLRPEGSRYRSYSWDDASNAAAFFNPNNLASSYVYINGDYQGKNGFWTTEKVSASEEEKAAGEGESLTCAKVLTICCGNSETGDTDTTLTSYLTGDLGDEINPDMLLDTTLNVDRIKESGKLYRVADSSVILGGYHPMKASPAMVYFDTMDIAAGINMDGRDLSSYDYIIIESGTGAQPMNDEMRSALTSAMMANVHILYNASLKDSSSTVTVPSCTAANYKYILEKVANANEVATLSNVLVTTKSKVSAYASAQRPKSVDAVAEIIINGSFRGMGGGDGSSTNLYTVLEIQPAYPIDSELALQLEKIRGEKDPLTAMTKNDGSVETFTFQDETNRNNMRGDGSKNYAQSTGNPRSFYYLRANGMTDQSIDEISYDGSTSLAMMKDSGTMWDRVSVGKLNNNYANVYDYYAWSLTKAKIAHAKGLSVNDINLVHMSSVEFNTSKATLLDSYDAIYIGGDYSSIKSDHFWEASHKNLNYYKMYFHDGDVYTAKSGLDGFSNDSMTGVLLGNDITTDKKKELEEYIGAGMPVVVDKALADAYANVDAPGQTLLDPTSNMRAFLDKAGAKAGSGVLWGFDNTATMKVDNSDGSYGTTVNGFATVFAGSSEQYVYQWTGEGYELVKNTTDGAKPEDDLKLLLATKQRPRLLVKKQPRSYVEGDESSWYHTGDTASFEAEVNGGSSKAVVQLIIDNNGDSRFTTVEDGDDVRTLSKGSNGTYSCTYVPDNEEFFGPLYWKLIVTDGDLSASTTGMFKIARDDKPKAVVNLLELIPSNLQHQDTNNHSLFFCRECQQSRGILSGNRYNKNGKTQQQALEMLTSGFWDDNAGNPAGYGGYLNGSIDVNGYLSNDAKYHNTNYEYEGNNLGVHEHKFGIVKYYENKTTAPATHGEYSTTGIDDWTTNWMDDVKADYDVYLDIMDLDEYHAIVNSVNAEYDTVKHNAGIDGSPSEADLIELSKAYEKVSEGYKKLSGEYESLWKTMKTIIDGNYSELSSSEIDKLACFLAKSRYNRFTYKNAENKDVEITDKDAYFTESELDAITAMISDYANAHAELQKIIKDEDTGLLKTDFENLSDADRTNEYYVLTNVDTPGSELPYYDVYSYVNSANGNSPSFYTKYNKEYKNWRNAKILEQYFYKNFRTYTLKAAVNYKLDYSETSNRNDRKYFGQINLSDAYNCIAIGAVWQFNNDDMKADEDCVALLDYIDEGGSVFLFRDTLTANSSGTTRMTRMLSEAFGQNARHYVKKNKGEETDLVDSVLSLTYKKNGYDDITKTYGIGKTTLTEGIKLTLEGNYNMRPAPTVTLSYGGNENVSVAGDKTASSVTYRIKAGDQTFVTGDDTYRIYVYKNKPGQYDHGNIFGTIDLTAATTAVNWNIVTDGNNIIAGESTRELVEGTSGSHDVAINITYTVKKQTSWWPTAEFSYTPEEKDFYVVINPKKDTDYNDSIKMTTGSALSIANHELTYSAPEVIKGDPLPGEGAGTQTYSAVIVDSEDPSHVLSTEAISMTVDGTNVSGAGIATTTRDNYSGKNVTGFKLERDPDVSVQKTTEASDDVTLNFKAYDFDGVTELKNQEFAAKVSYNKPSSTELVSTYDGSLVIRDGSGTITNLKNYHTTELSPYFVVSDKLTEKQKVKYFYKKNNKTANLNPTAITTRLEVGETDSLPDYNSDRGVGIHKYVLYSAQSETNNQILHGSKDIRDEIRDLNHVTTDRAEQCNEGIVTMYPFLIGSQLKVTPTNPQDYAVDIEDPNMTVYYTLSGGSTGTSSTMMVADPKNGAENYFLYQYNSVTYTGAGRSLITGIGRNNNDERRLFINVILNSARPSVRGASVNLYDPDATLEEEDGKGLTNKIVKHDPLGKDDYLRYIEGVDEMPDFSYIATVDDDDKIDRVLIYWDLPAGKKNEFDKKTDGTPIDVKIFDSKPETGEYQLGIDEGIGSGLLKVIDEDTPYMYKGTFASVVNVTLKPLDEYFTEGKAYIVVQVWSKKSDTPVTKRLRIELKPERMHLN